MASTASEFNAGFGGFKVGWDIFKDTTNTVFDEKQPTGKRIAYGVGGSVFVASIGTCIYCLIKQVNS